MATQVNNSNQANTVLNVVNTTVNGLPAQAMQYVPCANAQHQLNTWLTSGQFLDFGVEIGADGYGTLTDGEFNVIGEFMPGYWVVMLSTKLGSLTPVFVVSNTEFLQYFKVL